jgi:hypothetical protein
MRSKPRRSSVRRWREIARAGAVALVLTPAAAGVLDCYGHQCDASTSTFPSDAGRMLDDNTFETNAIDEPWLKYPGNVTLRVKYPMEVGRPMSWLEPYVGTSEQPSQNDGSTWILASGALAELSSSDATGFSVLNATCASYFARFVVHFAPRSAADGGVDAPQGSAISDAGGGASTD